MQKVFNSPIAHMAMFPLNLGWTILATAGGAICLVALLARPGQGDQCR